MSAEFHHMLEVWIFDDACERLSMENAFLAATELVISPCLPRK